MFGAWYLPSHSFAQMTCWVAGLFKRWITLSTVKITAQWIPWFLLLTLIHWIAIYLVDNVISL